MTYVKEINNYNTIRNKLGILERIRQSMRRRLECCNEVQGGHFEHFL